MNGDEIIAMYFGPSVLAGAVLGLVICVPLIVWAHVMEWRDNKAYEKEREDDDG